MSTHVHPNTHAKHYELCVTLDPQEQEYETIKSTISNLDSTTNKDVRFYQSAASNKTGFSVDVQGGEFHKILDEVREHTKILKYSIYHD